MKKVLHILCLLAVIGLSNGIVQAGIVTSKANLGSAGLLSQAGTPIKFAVQGTQVMIGGSLVNNSSETISNITIYYTDGTNTFADNQSVSIAPGATFNYTHSTPYVMPPVGDYQITSWVALNGDQNLETNRIVTHAKSVLFTPVKKVTFEEETGCWCGFCVRGLVFMDSMMIVHPTTTELIAVHDGDPMVFNTYDAGATNQTYYPSFTGFPSIEIDRLGVDDPSNIFLDYANYIGDFGLADIGVSATLNGSVATINVTTHFASAVGSGYKLACVITENRVHNTSSTYDQHNYYSGGSYGPLNNLEYDFVTLPNPVPAAQMYFDNVARSIMGSYEGTTGSLPSTINAGDAPAYTFTYTIPTGYVASQMKAIVLLINTNTTPAPTIMNANHTMLGLNGIPVTSDIVSSLGIYPNPFNNEATVNFSLNKDENVSVIVSNLLGQDVITLNNGLMSAGEHNIKLNGSTLPSGMYFVTLKAGDYSTTQKVLLNK